MGKIAAVEPNSGAHVADGGTVGERHVADALTVELHELADDTVLAQHSVIVRTTSVAVAPEGI